MKRLAALATLALAACPHHPETLVTLEKLRGQSQAEVGKALCDACDVSRDGKRMKCRVYVDPPPDNCGGRHDKMILFFDGGKLATWQYDD